MINDTNNRRETIKAVALTILAQIGGEQFLMMVKPLKVIVKPGQQHMGAVEIVMDGQATKDNGTRYLIELTLMDEYDIEYFKFDYKGQKEIISSHHAICFKTFSAMIPH